MPLITLSPRIDVNPAQHLRSPGMVLLRDYLDPYAITAPQLARRSGMRVGHIRDIITGTRQVRPNDALRLAAVLRTSAFYWLVLQARYDLEREQQKHCLASSIIR